MPPHKINLIVNPNANLGRAWRASADLRPIVEEFGGADWAGTVYPTHAIELARSAAEQGYELVIAAGGDGTIHEVVNGLMRVPAEKRPKLGIVPLGSGNDFSYAIGMDKRPAFALRQVFAGNPKLIDVGLLQDDHGRKEYFANGVGVGFDATVTIRSRHYTMLQGFSAYMAAVLQTIALDHEAPSMHIQTDQEIWDEATMMLVMCNGPREGGGFLVAPEAKPDDGVFHYASVRQVSRLVMMRLLPEVVRGTHGRFSQVRMGTFKELNMKSDRPIYVHTDGEIFVGFGMDVRQLSVQVIPGALEVVV